jgi:large subunit ribosomal protein L4
MAVANYTKSGTKSTSAVKLDKNVFGLEVDNHELIKANYVAYLANGRQNLAQTKTRGLVRGGGKKPWRQKGTGRARFGSSRNPIWRGGGIVFGPTGLENYTHKVNKSAKRTAIKQVLSLANKENKLIIIEDLNFKDSKTKSAVTLLNKIGATKNTLLVVADKTPELERSVSNLAKVKLIQANYVNVFDALNADHVVLTSEALKIVSEWLGGGDK